MLQIDGLTKRFGDTTAVRQLSFRVNGGEIVGLLGPNGAGKTTTLRCIASILRPTAGRILVNGQDLAARPSAAKQGLAFVPELPNPYDLLTVLEHLRFIAAAFDEEDELVHAESLLKRLDLWEKRHAMASTLSKGMKQKLACACAFIHRPSVFCFDEPIIGIDPKGVREFKDLLLERRAQGNAIIVSTHMLDTAERLCDRVVIMHRGEVVGEGSMDELHERMRMGENATLEEMFLQLTAESEAS